MRTDTVKLSPATVATLSARMGYQNARVWDNLLHLAGAELISVRGDRMKVTPDMEVIFAETVDIEPRGNLAAVYKVTFTNGDTLEGFAPYWLKPTA